MKSLRFNPPIEWSPTRLAKVNPQINNITRFNRYFMGFNMMLSMLCEKFSQPFRENTKMIEIGAYSGESTLLFGATMAFDHIYCIDPFEGEEEMHNINNKTWEDVKRDFENNTKWFDGSGKKLGQTKVELIEDYSYNVVDKFDDNSIDFVYIDASHKVEDIKRDIDLYIPKLKDDGILGGHDYNFIGVDTLVHSYGGDYVHHFMDESWAIEKQYLKV
jgi:hypothetical protein